MKKLIKLKMFNEPLDRMYIATSGKITKRRIKVLQVGDNSFRAHCYLRKSERTFRVDNILELVPVIQKESMVILNAPYEGLPNKQIASIDMCSFYTSYAAAVGGLDVMCDSIAVDGNLKQRGSVVLGASPQMKKRFKVKTK